MELPCIAHTLAEGHPQLQATLETGGFDYVVITSPEVRVRSCVFMWIWEWGGGRSASRSPHVLWRSPVFLQQTHRENMHTHTQPPQAAHVFLDVAQACRAYAPTNLVPIGEATGTLLTKAGGQIAFAPSKALAKVLAVELPPVERKEVGELLVVDFGRREACWAVHCPIPPPYPTCIHYPMHAGPDPRAVPGVQEGAKDAGGRAGRAGRRGRPAAVRSGAAQHVRHGAGRVGGGGDGGWLGLCLVLSRLVWFGRWGSGDGHATDIKSPGLVFMCFIKPRGHIHTDRLGPARARW